MPPPALPQRLLTLNVPQTQPSSPSSPTKPALASSASSLSGSTTSSPCHPNPSPLSEPLMPSHSVLPLNNQTCYFLSPLGYLRLPAKQLQLPSSSSAVKTPPKCPLHRGAVSIPLRRVVTLPLPLPAHRPCDRPPHSTVLAVRLQVCRPSQAVGSSRKRCFAIDFCLSRVWCRADLACRGRTCSTAANCEGKPISGS